jgi:predicted DCC family thiol-disulfide oxidoreductase YuxK
MFSPKITETRSIVYFDGVCNLCNFWVKWIRKVDRKSRFELRSLQSEEGKEFIKIYQMESGLVPDSVVYHRVKTNQVYFESDAVLNIIKDLGFGGKLIYWLLRLLPKFMLNAVYRWVARNRYKWFGTCELER